MKNTKQLTGRRKLRFETLTHALADAEQITAAPHHTLGNWTAAQNLDHLAMPILWALDGFPEGMTAPLPLRVLAPMLKGRLLRKPLSAGIKPPPSIAAGIQPQQGLTLAEGLDRLRGAVRRFQQEPTIPRHLFLGALSKPQWEQFQCRHCELHLSFIVPGTPAAAHA